MAAPQLLGDQGQLTLLDAADLLAAVPALAFAVSVERTADGPRVLRLEVTKPVQLVRVASRSWDYGAFLFHSATIRGVVAAEWLRSKSVSVADLSAGMSLADQAAWERLPSHAQRDRPPCPWPQVQARFGSPNGPLYPLTRPKALVGPGAPTFPSPELATEAFFRGFGSLAPPQSDSELLVLRLIDDRCRFGRLVFDSVGLDVQVEGSDTFGCRLELTSNVGHQETTVEFGGRAHLDLPDGMPSEWWAVLSREHEWLDFRYFMPYSPASAPGVEVVADEVDPADAVASLMANGESLTREFKSQTPTDGDGRRKVARTVAAFANGEGGVILFGIDRDEFTICGVTGEFPQLRDQLNSMVADSLSPRPDIDIRAYEVNGKTVIALEVSAGDTPPYGVGPADPRYYIRRTGSTVPARPEDIRRLVAARSPQAEPTVGSRWM